MDSKIKQTKTIPIGQISVTYAKPKALGRQNLYVCCS